MDKRDVAPKTSKLNCLPLPRIWSTNSSLRSTPNNPSAFTASFPSFTCNKFPCLYQVALLELEVFVTQMFGSGLELVLIGLVDYASDEPSIYRRECKKNHSSSFRVINKLVDRIVFDGSKLRDSVVMTSPATNCGLFTTIPSSVNLSFFIAVNYEIPVAHG
ncbi:hypothetical protein J6590_015928 [Homalodisca vitripennis]|nr:hypothetical protein J6590_015928 [Homalodisca vitripennis]